VLLLRIGLLIRCVCCSVLQCVAVCRSVLRWDVVDCVAASSVADHECGLPCVAVCCGVLQCVESAADVYSVAN